MTCETPDTSRSMVGGGLPGGAPKAQPAERKAKEQDVQEGPAAPLAPSPSPSPGLLESNSPATAVPPSPLQPRLPGTPPSSPAFKWDGKLIVLTGANNVQAWAQQTEAISRASQCHAEMTNKFSTGFPQPGTAAAFICASRFSSAWRILNETVSGPVWAYMRVLGYAPMDAGPPTPCDAFGFARIAGVKMNIPGTAEQPWQERVAMVNEVLTHDVARYPSPKHHKKGITWLRDVLDHYIRQGDWQVATMLYGHVPDWARQPVPRPAGSPTSASPMRPPSTGVGRIPALPAGRTAKTDTQSSEEPIHGLPAIYVPSSPGSYGTRKRPWSDIGDE